MSALEVDPGGDLTITNLTRTVLDTSGNLVMGLPSANDYVATVTVAFPDFSKDWLYNWRGSCHYNGGNVYGMGERADSFIAVLPASCALSR